MKRVVIFEAGIGAMSIAFKAMGFEIAAAYGADTKAEGIYRYNLGEELLPYGFLELKEKELPEMDVLAGTLPLWEDAPKMRGYRKDAPDNPYLRKLAGMIRAKRPKVFLVRVNRSLLRERSFEVFCQEMQEAEYHIVWQGYDVRRLTGIPVQENEFWLVGTAGAIGKEFRLLEDSGPLYCGINEICRAADRPDTWYYGIEKENIRAVGDEDAFLCWRENGYVETETVSWNYRKIPLVRINGEIHRLTHREMARMKGFLDEFWLDCSNKAWMYKALIYSPNVRLMRQIAQSVSYLLDEDSVRSRKVTGAAEFDALLERYINGKCGRDGIRPDMESGWGVFLCSYEGRPVYIESKFYTNNELVEEKIFRFCEKMRPRVGENEGLCILIVANRVEEAAKEKCREDYGIHVWDVANLLWLFADEPDIRNEFVAMLSYTVTELAPQRAEPEIFGTAAKKPEGLTLGEKLKAVKSGRAQFALYEEVCVEILKYVLGDYLTLWKTQKKTNDDLYRFDLCCKIKHGELQDFFDTVKNFFGTKYIVFEFKNYTEQITQKEIYTTEKYLYEKALRRVAILISRNGADEHAKKAARGCLRESGKLILCLSDADLQELLLIKEKGEVSTAEYLSDMLDEMLLCLEK